MKIFKAIILVAAVFLCVLQAGHLEARGTVVNVESLSSGNFNPWVGGTNVLTFAVLQQADVTIRLFTTKNVMVREKRLKDLKEGRYKFTWDGRDGKNKLVDPGFYKYELIASTQSGTSTDRDQTVVEVRKDKRTDMSVEELPPALYTIDGVSGGPSLSMDFSGYLRSGTTINTGGVGWNREELYLQMRGDYGSSWVYDLAFFPAYTMNQSFAWSNLVYNALIEYSTSWGKINAGYRNYLEGYNDPLNLLADYQMGSDRISLGAGLNFLPGLDISAGLHRLTDLNEVATDFRGTYEIMDGFTAGGCLVTKNAYLYSNMVIGGDARVDFGRLFSIIPGLSVAFQTARNVGTTQVNTTTNAASFGGFATRFEVEYYFLMIPQRFGNLGLDFAWENIGQSFAADYADLPNGIDSTGVEIGATYDKMFGFSWLRTLRSETKAGFLTNTTQTQGTQKFRQGLSLGFTDFLSLVSQYEHDNRDTINIFTAAVTPLVRNHNVFAEIRYHRPVKGWDVSLRQTTSFDSMAGARSEYTSSRLVCGYNVTENLSPYAGYERVLRFYGAGVSTNRDYNYWTAGTKWTVLPQTKTQLHLQAGLVTHNNTAPSANSALTYYAKLQHYFFDAFSLLASYGSLTSSEPTPQFYLEAKWEFN